MCEELGKQSYQKALWGDYEGAIDILAKAIKKYPKEPRFYNNRCFCYYHLKDYKRALADADFMISKFPNYIKSYYRRGEILMDLKRFSEAEVMFSKVLVDNKDCDDAYNSLMEARISQLCCGNKCTRKEAKTALDLAPDITEAAELLTCGALAGANGDLIYYSDEEILEESTPPVIIVKSDNNVKRPDPFTDPDNPFNCPSIWVGNVGENITEEMIKPLFNKYGKVKSIIVHHQHFCAFVNYYDAATAGKVMKNFPQGGKPFHGTNLVIRYPDNAKLYSYKNGHK